ncbi:MULTISPECIES: hypothetical protein [unclassified Streptomyces]|uniref:hypothetical protein n=1 Tax=unclassified Streptomyces TaxID=2593676 RepID=UPI00278C8B37|nr:MULTISPECIES: hypothetical protein [unclassified Streptomyces]
MFRLAEATDMQILARLAGVVMSAFGAIMIIFAAIISGAVRQDREEGKFEAAAKVKRNVLIILGLGIVVLGGGAALYFTA